MEEKDIIDWRSLPDGNYLSRHVIHRDRDGVIHDHGLCIVTVTSSEDERSCRVKPFEAETPATLQLDYPISVPSGVV